MSQVERQTNQQKQANDHHMIVKILYFKIGHQAVTKVLPQVFPQ